jgi:hypothetical protein
VSGFLDRFAIGASESDLPKREEAVTQPVWFGPPEGELGVVVPQSLVLGRSPAGVIALRWVTAFSNGLQFDLVAAARGLKESRTQALFHEQHFVDPDESVADGFLRVGVEYPDGSQASNLGGRHRQWQPNSEPEGPVLFQSGGGGGSAGAGRVTMNPGYWLWPLPTAGALRLFVEWPIVEIELCSVELAADQLLDAASRSEPLWASPE